jgi:hypothetical protein
MNIYREKTRNVRTNNCLVIATINPYNKAPKATIARWVKSVLKASGIDSNFKPNSIRSASPSKAEKECKTQSHIKMLKVGQMQKLHKAEEKNDGRQTAGQPDGQADSSIPPLQLCCAGV